MNLLLTIPDLQLRLDANRAWTPISTAFAKYVNPAYRQRIAFLEEPCKAATIRVVSQQTIVSPGIILRRRISFVAEPGVRARW